MATYSIKWLKNLLGTKFFPITHVKAVRDDNNTNLETLLSGKQQTLVSGSNIKTINGESVLGSGNISVSGGGGGGDVNVIESISVNGTGQAVDANKNVNLQFKTVNNNNISGTGNISIAVPTKVSDLTNDAGYITGYTETDPVFSASVAAEITSSDITNWNGKTSNIGTITSVKMNGTTVSSSGEADLGTVITSHQDISGKADKSATVSNVTYNTTSKKITKTINGTTTDVVTAAKIVTDGGGITTETDPTVPSWAKASSKPSYTASEVGAVPTTRTVNGKALSADITLSASDVSALPSSTAIPSKTSDLTNDSGYLTSADISGVYKYKGSKTNYSNLPTSGNVTGDVWNVVNAYSTYPAGTNFAWDGTAWDALGGSVDLSGYVPTSRTINGKALSSNITLSASDVSALPSSTVIPDELSDLSDDATHRLVTDTEKSTWNSKGTYSKPSGGIPKTDLASAVQTSLGLADSALQSYTESDPVFTASAAHGISSTDISNWNAKGTYSKPSGGIPKTDLASSVQTSLGKADTALQSYTETDPVFTASGVTLGTEQTITGKKTFSGTGLLTIHRPGSNNSPLIWFSAGDSSTSRVAGFGASYGVDAGLFRLSADGTTAYTLWDKGNDGSGSGLDADLLDGQHASAFATKSTSLSGYGITDAYTKTEVDTALGGYLPLSGGTLTGGIKFDAGKGIVFKDSNNSDYVALIDNGENLWIGAVSTNGIHHTGATYISAGTGNVNISRLVNGTRLNYMVLDTGNYSSYALPLSGGTLTGNLHLQNNVSIYSYDSNDASKNIFGLNSLNNLTIGWDIKTLYNTYLCGKNIYFNANNGTRMFINSSGNVGIGTTSPSSLLHVAGVVKCTSVDTSSDETIKNKVGDINIKVEDIAAAPNLTFTWKNGEDTESIHGGTYAQYWEKITPYYVHGEEGDKSLEYSPLAVSCSIQLAKEIVTLKEENAQLKKELAEIKEMISKLNK